MATRIVTRAVQQASQTRLLSLLLRQSFSEPRFAEIAERTEQSLSPQLVFAPFLDEQSQQPWLPLGLRPYTDATRNHESFFFFNKFPPHSALAPHLDLQLRTQIQKLEFDLPLLNNLHLQDSVPEVFWKFTNSNYLPPSSEIDEVILPSYHEDTSSPMLMNTKRTFNPSTLVRKRRHGFLARKRTVGGRRILARRFLKGRRKLSA